jgi:hypothetical protein
MTFFSTPEDEPIDEEKVLQELEDGTRDPDDDDGPNVDPYDLDVDHVAVWDDEDDRNLAERRALVKCCAVPVC